jgi:hypothetical protein
MHDRVCLTTGAGSDKPKKVPIKFTLHTNLKKPKGEASKHTETSAIEVNRSKVIANTQVNGISTSTRDTLQLSICKYKEDTDILFVRYVLSIINITIGSFVPAIL